MSKRRTKSETNDKIKISIIIIIITVFIVLASIAYRNASYTQTWLVCDKDIAEPYHETLKFKYDINDKLYGYYREERIHDTTPEAIQAYYEEYQKQLDNVKDNLDDNFQYEINKSDNEILTKTYISVSVYPSFFNKYINNSNISTASKIDDIKTYLESNNYKCEITRK